jgi:hypothetical protein
VWSKNSYGLALIIFQESSEPFTTPNWVFVRTVLAGGRNEEDISLPLVISLVMIRLSILMESVAERRFPEEY